MHLKIKEEYEKALQKRDEVRETLSKMESEEPKDSYTITITRDRLAYWEGKTEGLKFALDNLQKQ
ncbi:MAG: hypothetical protein JSV71_04560 [Nitrospiraceae bacterium]|nr:MAG: hypothetical protein JSV71_04560 [Nitrospiraceae bacterium]